MKNRTAISLFRPYLVSSMLLGWMLAAAPSAAQSVPSDEPYEDDSSDADTLFNEGMELMTNRDFAKACLKLKKSVGLKPRNAAKFRLAECYEKMELYATAWDLFLKVADEAKAAGMPDREKVARQRAAALEPKVPKLTLVVAPKLATLPGLRIEQDGAVVESPKWNVAAPVDPGVHVVSASATGKKKWQQSIHALAGKPLNITVPDLEDEAAPTAPAPASSGKAAPPNSQSEIKPHPGSGIAGSSKKRTPRAPLPIKMTNPPGVAYLSIESPEAPVAVYRETEGVALGKRRELVCNAPCDRIIDGRDAEFFLDHDGVRFKSTFEFEKMAGSVKIKVQVLPNNARFATGIISTILGSAALAATPFLALAAGFNDDPAWDALFWPNLIGGVLIGFPMGIVGIVYGRGRYHIESHAALVPSILPGHPRDTPAKGAVVGLSGTFF